MDNDRIHIYGQDAEGNKKRAFDLVLIHGHPYLETKNRTVLIRTPADDALNAIKKLKQESS